MTIKLNADKLAKKRILLLGDFFLDEFLYGDSARMSPEAPVPVINPQKSFYSLGGAGNVLSNLNNLSIKTTPLGILGKDSISKKIFYILKEKKINSKNFIVEKKYNGILKTRIVLKNQHIARIDYENINFKFALTHAKTMKAKILSLLKKTDILVVSDYGKGSLTDDIIKFSIESANKLRTTVIVDPRKMNSDYSIYAGASFVTPNLNELKNIFPNIKNVNSDIEAACKILNKNYNIKNIVVTRGDKGITFFNKNLKFHSASAAKEVYDVSGAGDTVVATLSACLLLNINIKKAIKLSNLCAGYVISLKGTQPITLTPFKNFLQIL